jgi:hypothetical protein
LRKPGHTEHALRVVDLAELGLDAREHRASGIGDRLHVEDDAVLFVLDVGGADAADDREWDLAAGNEACAAAAAATERRLGDDRRLALLREQANARVERRGDAEVGRGSADAVRQGLQRRVRKAAAGRQRAEAIVRDEVGDHARVRPVDVVAPADAELAQPPAPELDDAHVEVDHALPADLADEVEHHARVERRDRGRPLARPAARRIALEHDAPAREPCADAIDTTQQLTHRLQGRLEVVGRDGDEHAMLAPVAQPQLQHRAAGRLADEHELAGADRRYGEHLAVADGDPGGAHREHATVADEEVDTLRQCVGDFERERRRRDRAGLQDAEQQQLASVTGHGRLLEIGIGNPEPGEPTRLPAADHHVDGDAARPGAGLRRRLGAMPRQASRPSASASRPVGASVTGPAQHRDQLAHPQADGELLRLFGRDVERDGRVGRAWLDAGDAGGLAGTQHVAGRLAGCEHVHRLEQRRTTTQRSLPSRRSSASIRSTRSPGSHEAGLRADLIDRHGDRARAFGQAERQRRHARLECTLADRIAGTQARGEPLADSLGHLHPAPKVPLGR